jgi:hypothetical protein
LMLYFCNERVPLCVNGQVTGFTWTRMIGQLLGATRRKVGRISEKSDFGGKVYRFSVCY